MFFSISKEKKDNFPCHFIFGDLIINTDIGWHKKNIGNKLLLYKGYCEYKILEDELELITEELYPTQNGNFCCFVLNHDIIEIKTDKNRSFPIYYDNYEITNLKKLNNQVYSNEIIKIKKNLDFIKMKFQNYEKITTQEASEKEVIEKIDTILNEKFSKFFKNNKLPVKIFLSGGLDSLLLYSYAIKFKNIEIIKGEEFEFDYFWLKNRDTVKKFWAYNQLCHYKKPTILFVGTPGDEYMLRGPEIINLFCKTNNIDILKLLNNDEFSNCYHKLYFSQEKNIKHFKKPITKVLKNKNYCYNQILNILSNDYQHWHLGNTLTFTPLRDIEITKIILQLPLNTAIKQIMDGYITKKLIEKNDQNLLKCCSKYKNSENCMENLTELFF